MLKKIRLIKAAYPFLVPTVASLTEIEKVVRIDNSNA